MDLKQYRAKIANQAFELNRQAGVRDRLMNSGEYQTPHTVVKPITTAEVHRQLNELKHHYIHTVQQLNKLYPNGISTHVDTNQTCDDDHSGGNFNGKSVVRKTMKKIKAVSRMAMNKDSSDESSDESSDSSSDEEEPAIQGGKFHFMKSMKKFGNDFGTSLKNAGIKEATNAIAKEGVSFAKKNIGSLVSGAEQVLPEALPIAEEAAPLLLAAGMKKPRRTRIVSDKEKCRHELVRKLMNKHGCSLSEASSYIKEKNLEY
jgi:hypothetical protein